MTQLGYLPLYHKLYELAKYLYQIIRNFPKQYKYTLGQSILDLTWDCLDLLVEANSFLKQDRYQKVLKLSTTFDSLKIRLRLAEETGLISQKQFVHIQANYAREIGSMIGGWLKWCETNS